MIKKWLGIRKLERAVLDNELFRVDSMETAAAICILLGKSPEELESLKRDKDKIYEFIKGQAIEKTMPFIQSEDKNIQEIGMKLREKLNEITGGFGPKKDGEGVAGS